MVISAKFWPTVLCWILKNILSFSLVQTSGDHIIDQTFSLKNDEYLWLSLNTPTYTMG